MANASLRLIPASPTHRPLAIRVGEVLFKKADSDDEVAQIHRLNHETFVQELGQYAARPDGLLVDKFHDKNVYIIAKRGTSVVGMVALHDQAPFSVADRLPDPIWIERECAHPLEVRLLTLCPAERNRLVLIGLLWSVYRLALSAGYSDCLMSGVREQLALYERLGFVRIGAEKQAGRAAYTPMRLRLADLPEGMRTLAIAFERRAGIGRHATTMRRVSLLPGPPQHTREVKRALSRPSISHRDTQFVQAFQDCRRILAEMTQAASVALFVGSGTMANECVAGALRNRFGGRPGVVLVNGEFGRRLAEQAARWNLRFRTLKWEWGRAWDIEKAHAALRRSGRRSWIWGVHCETSTGVLNDLAALAAVARETDATLCADCISSVGSVPIDLSGVWLASGVSGKCIGAVAGIAMLFGNEAPNCDRPFTSEPPLALDPQAMFASNGTRFTFPSELLMALAARLREYAFPTARTAIYQRYAELGATVRRGIAALGSRPLAADGVGSPVVTTFAPLFDYSAQHFAVLCRSYGFDINAASPHLVQRGLVQIATMGDVRVPDCERLFRALRRWSRHAG